MDSPDNVFTGDMDAGVGCTHSRFADNTYLGDSFDSLGASKCSIRCSDLSRLSLRGLDRLEHWVINSSLKFNVKKMILLLRQSNAR